MTWNHRVIKTTEHDGDIYQIHEVYYNDSGVPFACTDSPVSPLSETVEGLTKECERFVKACKNPVLEMKDFEEGGKYWEVSTDELTVSMETTE